MLVLQQRELYGHALERLAKVLDHRGLTDLAEAARAMKITYGLSDAVTSYVQAIPQIRAPDKPVDRDISAIAEAIEKVLRDHPDDAFMAIELANRAGTSPSSNEWWQALNQLRRTGRITRRGYGPGTSYQWRAER